MISIKLIKIIILTISVAVELLLISSRSLSMPAVALDQNAPPPPVVAKLSPNDFVGSDTCKACHEYQFISFSMTAKATRK